ncbi:MAG: MFS transporter [Mycobacteriales bacterium]
MPEGGRNRDRGRLGRVLRAVALDRRPLAVPAFRRLWLGQTVTVVGSQMTQVAVPVQVYGVTHSSLDVGLTSMVSLLPLVVFGLLGGAIVDAMDRRTLLLITGSGLAVTSLALWAQALVMSPGSLPVLWSLVGVQSALFAINSPARSTVIPRLVPPDQVPAANALNQVVFNAGVILGPLAAGVLVAGGGLPWAYFIDAATFLVALYTLLRLPSMRPEGARRANVGSVAEGLRFLALRPLILMSFLVDIIAMVFSFPRALFPQLAATTYAGNGTALGWLYSGIAVGALVGAISGGWLSRVRRQGMAVLIAISVWSVAIMGFGLVSWLPAAILLLALAGLGDMVSAVFRSSILQTAAPDEMRGRLQGVFTVVVAGGPRLGDLRAGGFASFLSVGMASTVGGAICLVGILAIAWKVPSFRRYDVRDSEGGATAEAEEAALREMTEVQSG